MSQEITKKPDAYLCTGKATILAVIKLAEALAGLFVLYKTITDQYAVQKIVTNFFDGLSFSASSQSSFSSIYSTLTGSIAVILAFEALLIILDGFGSFFTRVAHKGAGLVRFCHIVRYIFSWVGFIGSFVVIFQYVKSMVEVANRASKINFSDVFTFLGSYELVLYIIVILGAFYIFMDYDLHVARVMKQVKKEIKAGEILPMKKKNGLGRISAWFAGVLFVSAVLSVVSLVGGNSILANIASVVQPVAILYTGASVTSIAIVVALAIKFLLVNRCNADFDSIRAKAE